MCCYRGITIKDAEGMIETGNHQESNITVIIVARKSYHWMSKLVGWKYDEKYHVSNIRIFARSQNIFAMR